MAGIELSLIRPKKEEISYLSGNNEDDETQYADPEWPHISKVYEILMHIVRLGFSS